MRVYTNVTAINARRNLERSEGDMRKSLERLSSGLRINRASDDAAGLAISEKLRSQIRGLTQASRNAMDGISMIQTAEGALDEVHAILQRMRELSVQAASGTMGTGERQKIGEEVNSLQAEITRIARTTRFGENQLLNGGLGATITASAAACVLNGVAKLETTGGTAGNYTVQVAAGTSSGLQFTVVNASGTVAVLDNVPTVSGLDTRTVDLGAGIRLTFNSQMTTAAADFSVTLSSGTTNILIGATATVDDKLGLSIGDMQATALGVDSATLTVDTETNAAAAIDKIDLAISAVSTQRAKLGALQNRLEHTINSLGVTVENLSSSESRIRDADFAKEAAAMIRGQILQQAGTSVASQANQLPQSVLSLLRQ